MSATALKLTAYFSERSRFQGRLLADELIGVFSRYELHAGVLLRGAHGFGAKQQLHTDRLLTLSEDLPVVALAVDDRQERMGAAAEEIGRLVASGLVTLERARLAYPSAELTISDGRRWSRAEEHLEPPEELGFDKETMGANGVKLTAYLGRHERVDGGPAFIAACAELHRAGVAGATVLLGVDGTRLGRRERARFFSRNALVPTMILAVGEPAEMADALAILQAMLPRGMFTLERVRLCKRDGHLIQTPDPAVQTGDRLKLTVVTSEAARHDGRPVHLELIRRVRAARAAGATAVRGVWGFHGAHAPHGDRLLSIRRHVPIVTVLIDTPERIERLFPIVDELTAERGLVTSELVPANIALSCGCSSVG